MRITRKQLRQIIRESLNEIALDIVNQEQARKDAQQRLNNLNDILNDDEMLRDPTTLSPNMSRLRSKYEKEIAQICKEYPDLEGCSK